jgi:hypothetical protein
MKIIEEIKKRVFPFFVLISALSVSASAAFYSVTGLSKLFAGASTEVLIMSSTLEIAKLIVASLLYQNWNEINKTLRFYLSLSVMILIVITSMGIYGFLSSAYQETSTKYDIIQKEINVLELKKERFTEDRTYLINEKTQLDNGITELRNGLSNNVVQYKDPETGEIITTTSSSTRKVLESQLNEAIERRNGITNKLEAVTDSITSIDVTILNTESNSDIAGELGPLKYISELIDKPMSEVVNILLLIIIFVFDPLAISLVIAANFLFDNLKHKKDPKLLKEEKEKQLSRKIVYKKRDAEN